MIKKIKAPSFSCSFLKCFYDFNSFKTNRIYSSFYLTKVSTNILTPQISEIDLKYVTKNKFENIEIRKKIKMSTINLPLQNIY